MALKMDLERAVGKLITGKIAGTSLDSATERLIVDGTISGVTLFKDNADKLEQLVLLLDRVRELGGADFLVTVDQEGGAVQRFDHVITPLPSAMALAALGDRQRVARLMSLSARQLGWLEVNCNLTPVLDVNSNPMNPIIATRSFGSDPQSVTMMAEAVAEAYVMNGILPVGKHFPGHGDTAEDSHLSLAVAHADRLLLQERELLPFAKMARSLPAMLIGHVWLPAFDAEPIPASLSAAVTTTLLRNQLGFDGFLLTDDMPVMRAIVDHYGLEDAAVMAINAGADNLLISGTTEQMESVHQAIMRALAAGILTESRIAQSLERRARALKVCRRDRQGSVEQRIEAIRQSLPAGFDLALQTSAEAAALLRGSLPDLRRDESAEWVLLVPDHPRYKLNILSELSDQLEHGRPSLHERRFSLNPSADEIAEAATFARGKKCLLLTYRGLLNRGQLQLAEAVAEVSSYVLAVACDVPYELNLLPPIANALALFDPSDLAMSALARLLTGQEKPQGRSPVDMQAVALS